MTIDPDRLQTVLAPDTKTKPSVSAEPIAQGVNRAQEHAQAVMVSALTAQSNLIVVPPPTNDEQLIHSLQRRDLKAPLSQAEADRIRATTGADVLLRFGITDYGLTPKSWRKGYVTFEVTTTLAIAGVIAYSGSTVAKAAAGTYLVQETVEETIETYAGFWGLDVVGRPVRIEAELVWLNPVTVVWKTSDTGLADAKLSRLVREVQPKERDEQLDLATDHAARGIVSDLAHAVETIKSEPDRRVLP